MDEAGLPESCIYEIIVSTSLRTSVTELHVSIKLWVSPLPKSISEKKHASPEQLI